MISIGIRGIKTFITIVSMPIYLLKLDLPRRATFLTKSESNSGILSSLFMRFLSIWMRRVGSDELLVISWFGSSDVPLIKMFDRTFKPTKSADFLSFCFNSYGVI